MSGAHKTKLVSEVTRGQLGVDLFGGTRIGLALGLTKLRKYVALLGQNVSNHWRPRYISTLSHRKSNPMIPNYDRYLSKSSSLTKAIFSQFMYNEETLIGPDLMSSAKSRPHYKCYNFIGL